ncbi:MAG: NCS2 family nucleobase:cation symporter [Brockia lithotrophica]|nr:NCS2 family nucleobase:cation symporter [Brockia lithotrophica]
MVRSEDRPTPVGIRPLYDVEETPPFLRLLPLSLQHVFAMFGATVLVPILTGLDVQAALLASGLGTILFLLVTRGQIPNYLGSSFAFIGPILTVTHAAGVGAALLGAFLSGVLYLIFAWLVHRAGTRWLDAVLPPVLVGSIVAVIGLALSGVAVSWALADPTRPQGGNSLAAAEVALVTVAVVLLVNLYGRGLLGVLPVLTGVVLGTGYAYLRHPEWFTAGPDGGFVGKVAQAAWFLTPAEFFSRHAHTLEVARAALTPEAWLFALTIAPIAFVTLAEHIGHLLVTERVIGRPLVPLLPRSLLGDGLAVMLAAWIGGPPSTTYGENIGVLAVSRVYSRAVLFGAAVLAALLAFVEKLGAALLAIPKPVLGGVMIVLFGVIAAQGLRMFVEYGVDLAHRRNMLLVAVVLVTGIGGFRLDLAGTFLGGVPFSLTVDNIALATLLGIFLHLVLPERAVAYGRTTLTLAAQAAGGHASGRAEGPHGEDPRAALPPHHGGEDGSPSRT